MNPYIYSSPTFCYPITTTKSECCCPVGATFVILDAISAEAEYPIQVHYKVCNKDTITDGVYTYLNLFGLFTAEVSVTIVNNNILSINSNDPANIPKCSAFYLNEP